MYPPLVVTTMTFMATQAPWHMVYSSFNVHHVPKCKCTSCHKAILLITGRANCFHNFIYILHSSCSYKV